MTDPYGTCWYDKERISFIVDDKYTIIGIENANPPEFENSPFEDTPYALFIEEEDYWQKYYFGDESDFGYG